MRRALFAASLLVTGCELDYPEVVVKNRLGEAVLLKDVSFNGCAWSTVLAEGDATSPGRCLPGEDRVHFAKFDAAAYCREQAKDGTLAGVCSCESSSQSEMLAGLTNLEPFWFHYQTVSTKSVDYGDFRVFEMTPDAIEQDFSIAGPYGH